MNLKIQGTSLLQNLWRKHLNIKNTTSAFRQGDFLGGFHIQSFLIQVGLNMPVDQGFAD